MPFLNDLLALLNSSVAIVAYTPSMSLRQMG